MTINLSALDLLVIVAGISGAGRSVALQKIADLGFYVVDNLPIPLIKPFLNFAETLLPPHNRAALTVDTDTPEKVSALLAVLESIEPKDDRVHVIFLDSDNDVILKRYSETRRPHPRFAPTTDTTLEETITRERERLAPLKFKATLTLNTSGWSIHDLRREVAKFFAGLSRGIVQPLRVNVISFGFKYGPVRECDLIADVRFLPNPHFVPELKAKTGLDEAVSNFVLSSPEANEFVTRYSELLNFMLPKYRREGKAYLNIGIGCTGGKHRSVAIAEEIKKRIAGDGLSFSIRHRDLFKE